MGILHNNTSKQYKKEKIIKFPIILINKAIYTEIRV